MAIPNQLDLVVSVTTPENIQFDYQLAGPFRRLPAMMLDTAIRFAVIIVVVIVILILGLMTLNLIGPGLTTAIIFVVVFLLSWFYGLFFEAWMNGQTPGKRAMGLRVVSIDGRHINTAQAAIRNFVRVADFFPYASLKIFGNDFPDAYVVPTFLVALICMILTKRFQRLGDLAAGTMVIVDQRSWRPTGIQLEDPRIESFSEVIPSNFRMTRSMSKAVSFYVQRRTQLSHARREEVAGLLGGTMIKQFGMRSDTSSDLLLCTLFYREFLKAGSDTEKS